MDTKFISELADIINTKGLRELEYSSKDERILLVRNYEQYDDRLDIDDKNFDNKNKLVENNSLPIKSNESFEGDDEINCDCESIKANIIGTFYDKPSPDEAAFVHAGKTVKKGDVVCIIESMKLMNEIKAPFDCEILSINVENEEIVEFGQALFDVRVIK